MNACLPRLRPYASCLVVGILSCKLGHPKTCRSSGFGNVGEAQVATDIEEPYSFIEKL